MVKISLSGSGEGSGSVTAPGYSTAARVLVHIEISLPEAESGAEIESDAGSDQRLVVPVRVVAHADLPVEPPEDAIEPGRDGLQAARAVEHDPAARVVAPRTGGSAREEKRGERQCELRPRRGAGTTGTTRRNCTLQGVAPVRAARRACRNGVEPHRADRCRDSIAIPSSLLGADLRSRSASSLASRWAAGAIARAQRWVAACGVSLPR